MFLFLGGAIAMPPSVWFLFHTKDLNERYDNLFAVEFGVYVAIAGAGGLMLAALLMFMWYCMCKKLPSPFWLPLPEVPVMSHGISAQPLMTNGLPSPVTYVPQSFPPSALDAPSFVPAQGYPQHAAPQPLPPQVYMPHMSMPDGYGSELGGSQAYSYAPSQNYAPSQGYAASQSYAPSQRYAGHRYSTRSQMSGIEIDIPILREWENTVGVSTEASIEKVKVASCVILQMSNYILAVRFLLWSKRNCEIEGNNIVHFI